MTSPARLPASLLLALLALLALPAVATADTARLDDAITDNYKASYNADPSQPELRTWLSMRSLSGAGTTWRPHAPQTISVGASTLELVADDGRRGTLTVRGAGGPLASLMTRVDPLHVESRGRWGVLIALSSRTALRDTPVTIELSLTSDGSVVSTGSVQYRHDPALASAAPGHLEYNGPGGRWHIGGAATRTEWEPAPASPPSYFAGAAPAAAAPFISAAPVSASAGTTWLLPRITRLLLPRVTTRRIVVLRVRGRAGSRRISHARVSVSARGFGPWTRIAPSYRLLLPRGTATRVVRVQLRDSAGRYSRVAARAVRCSCR